MPTYSNTTPPSAIWPGDSAQVWNAEQPATGNGGASASSRLALGMQRGSPGGFAVTGFFSAAPGTFEIDVQVSDVYVGAWMQAASTAGFGSGSAIGVIFPFGNNPTMRQMTGGPAGVGGAFSAGTTQLSSSPYLQNDGNWQYVWGLSKVTAPFSGASGTVFAFAFQPGYPINIYAPMFVRIPASSVAVVSAPAFSSASEAGNMVTFTTSAAHNLSRGEPIVVSGCSVSGHNGEFVLGNTISSTTFTVYNSATGLGSPTGCVITPENDSEVADWANNLKPYSDKCSTGVLCGVVSNPAISASGLNNIVFVDGVSYPLTDVGLAAAINALPAASSWSHCGTVVVPAGTITLSNTVAITSPCVSIRGAGPQSSIIAYSPTSGFGMTWTSTPYNNNPGNRAVGGLYDLTFYSNGSNLQTTDINGLNIQNVAFTSAGTTGTYCWDDESASQQNEAFNAKAVFYGCATPWKVNGHVASTTTFGYGSFNLQIVGSGSNTCATMNNANFGQSILLLVFEQCGTAWAITNSKVNLNVGKIDIEGPGGSSTGISLATSTSFQNNTVNVGIGNTNTYLSIDGTSNWTNNPGFLQGFQGSLSNSGTFTSPPVSLSNLLLSPTAPTISSGFGTSPSIVQQNGTAAFEVNVGTGGSATSGVIGLPTAANGWSCTAIDMNTNDVTRETAFTTTSVTLTAASAWTASDKLLVNCGAF